MSVQLSNHDELDEPDDPMPLSEKYELKSLKVCDEHRVIYGVENCGCLVSWVDKLPGHIKITFALISGLSFSRPRRSRALSFTCSSRSWKPQSSGGFSFPTSSEAAGGCRPRQPPSTESPRKHQRTTA